VEYAKLEGGLAGGDKVWGPGVWLAGNVPGWTPFEPGVSRYQSRFLSGSGRVFFNSSDALVPGDVDGVEDVYEFDPVGVAGCSEQSDTFVQSSGGCVSLVSSGSSSGESGFLDASESGGDVFFLTSLSLVRSDSDTALDVYDAHVCDGEAPCAGVSAVPPACSNADSCRTAPAGQPGAFGAPSSETFVGAGNPAPPPPPRPVVLSRAQKLTKALKVCHKDHKRKRRVACERRARGLYGPVRKTRKSTTGKGGHS